MATKAKTSKTVKKSPKKTTVKASAKKTAANAPSAKKATPYLLDEISPFPKPVSVDHKK